MKRLLSIILCVTMLFGMNTIAFASSDVKIKVNGELLSDAQAVLKDGSTLLPVRSVSTALGGEVVWDNATKTTSIDKDGTLVTIAIGEKAISVNGTKQSISTPAQIISGRTYVPLRALGEALECDITWVNATKTVEITQQVDPSEYKAWYEVDADGGLNIKTNIDGSHWKNGYSLLTRLLFEDGSYYMESKPDSGKVFYDCNSMLSYPDIGTIVKKTEFYVFDDRSTWTSYWDAYDVYHTHENALAAVQDKLIVCIELDNNLTLTESEDEIAFTDFNITYDTTNQHETYTVVIEPEISNIGEYGLIYKKEIGNKNAGKSHIHRDNDVLTFTREMNYFADAGSGASGTFYVTYAVQSMDADGNITAARAISNGIKHTFS